MMMQIWMTIGMTVTYHNNDDENDDDENDDENGDDDKVAIIHL